MCKQEVCNESVCASKKFIMSVYVQARSKCKARATCVSVLTAMRATFGTAPLHNAFEALLPLIDDSAASPITTSISSSSLRLLKARACVADAVSGERIY